MVLQVTNFNVLHIYPYFEFHVKFFISDVASCKSLWNSHKSLKAFNNGRIYEFGNSKNDIIWICYSPGESVDYILTI